MKEKRVELGHRIKVRRVELSLKQKELGAMIGLAQVLVSELERGDRKISLYEVPRLAKALQVPIMWFYEGLTDTDDIGIDINEVVH